MKIKDLITTSSKWEDPDPSVRLNAIRNSTPDESILIRLIAEDPDDRVRCAAVEQLESLPELKRLCATGQGALAVTARDRFVAVLNALDIAPALDAANALTDPALQKQVVLNAENVDLRREVLARIEEEQLLAELSLECNVAHLRQLAAARVTGSERVDWLMRESQNRDKSVYKIAREKHAELQRQDAKRHELEERGRTLVESLTQHANSAFGPAFERKWKSLQESWAQLESEVSALHETEPATLVHNYLEEVAEANRRCASKIDEARAVAADAEPPIEAPVDEALAVCDEADGVVARLPEMRLPLADLQAALGSLDEKWRALRKEGLATEITERYFKSVEQIDRALAAEMRWNGQREDLQRLLEEAGRQQDNVRGSTRKELRRLIGRLNWPDGVAAPEELSVAAAELERLEQLQQRLSEKEQQSREEIDAQLRQLEALITEGELKRAEKLLREVQHARGQLRSKSFQQDRINHLAVQIRELRDWQGYATNPKREELCERMEALILDELHARDKADRIKALQQEWKALGPSHSYKSQKLWYRFKEAGDKAYAPCLEYFRQQEAIREQNLNERETICTHLETFLRESDWERANWKAVAEIIQTAKREWRRFDNISRSKRKGIQNRFYRVIDQLQAKLGEEQSRNRDLKRELIAEVRELADDSVDLHAAINRTKAIQQQWKAIGVTERKTDQELWSEFRHHCDLVFERRNAQSQVAQREETDLVHRAEDLIRELEEATAEDGTADSLDRTMLQRTRRRFNELALPTRARRTLEGRFERACRTFEEELRRHESKAQELMISEMWRRAGLCTRLENECGPAEIDRCREMWEGESLCPLPEELARQIDGRWQYAQKVAAREARDLDRVIRSNLKQAELLCVRAELIAGIESPPEAQPLVMEYQVSRLNKELSRGEKETRSLPEQKQSLQLEWCCLGPLPADRLEHLKDRFERAVKTLTDQEVS